MEAELSPEAISALRSELARLEKAKRRILSAYDQNIESIRHLLNGAAPSPRREPPSAKKQAAALRVPFRKILREVLLGHDHGISPTAVFEELRQKAVLVPGGDQGLKTRVYVELAKLHEGEEAGKKTAKDGSPLYFLRAVNTGQESDKK